MRKRAALIAALFLFSVSFFQQAESATALNSVAEEWSQQYNNYIQNMPDFAKSILGNETIEVDLKLKDGSAKTFGVKTENGKINETSANPFAGSTIRLHATEGVLEKISSSKNPSAALNNALGKEIRIEGLNLATSIKLFFGELAFRIINIFNTPKKELSPATITTSADTSFTGSREDGFRISLQGWWNGSSASNGSITIDPVGGLLYAFWLDDNGNVCSGFPNHSGQAIAFSMLPDNWERIALLRRGESISEESLALLQNDYYSIDGYSEMGKHIFQYYPRIWRDRETGLGIGDDAGNPSVPFDGGFYWDHLSLSTYEPAAARDTLFDCFYRDSMPVPSPAVPDRETRQDPERCMDKTDVNATDLINACLEGRLEGSIQQGFFRIS